MEITEVRIKLMEGSEDRLRAFCSITFDDCFVVRDLKIIDGNSGPFVAMPSRKLTSHCNRCNTKNHLKARFCNHCGTRLEQSQPEFDQHGRAKLYADIAHPINAACREAIQSRVIEEFKAELELANDPDYVSRYDDAYHSDVPDHDDNEFEIDKFEKQNRRIDTQHEGVMGPHRQTRESQQLPNHRKPNDEDQFGSGIFD